jgi:hypothetical protein
VTRPITILILLGLGQLSCVSYAQKNVSPANVATDSQSNRNSKPPYKAANSNTPIRSEDPLQEPSSDELERLIPDELRKRMACSIEENVTITPDEGGPAPLKVTFDASESTAPCGKIVRWIWTFGDGGKGAGAEVTHIYKKPGSYTATLEMFDSKGNSNYVELEYLVAVN